MNPRKQYEKEHPERAGEADKIFAESLYIEWLEAKVIAAQPDVIKSVCDHRRRHFDITLGGWICKDCNEKISEQTVL